MLRVTAFYLINVSLTHVTKNWRTSAYAKNKYLGDASNTKRLVIIISFLMYRKLSVHMSSEEARTHLRMQNQIYAVAKKTFFAFTPKGFLSSKSVGHEDIILTELRKHVLSRALARR